MEFRTVKIKDLKKGDILSSGAEVISDPVSLVRTPKGKVIIVIRYRNGTIMRQEWNSNGKVKVLWQTL